MVPLGAHRRHAAAKASPARRKEKTHPTRWVPALALRGVPSRRWAHNHMKPYHPYLENGGNRTFTAINVAAQQRIPLSMETDLKSKPSQGPRAWEHSSELGRGVGGELSL